MSAEYHLTLNDYLMIIRRRGALIVSAFALIFVVAVVVAVTIPPVYQSTGVVLVESQQIPNSIIENTNLGRTDERIKVIQQRVMTRDNLLRIIDKYRLFSDMGHRMTPTDKIDRLREQISVELINSENKRRDMVTVAFKLSYDDRDPDAAHRVANELVTLFLDENVKTRTARATETTEFLSQEAGKLKLELEALESQLAQYKQRHDNALPQHLELRMNMLQRVESELKDVEREYKTTQEELRFLDVELASTQAGMGAPPIQPVPVAVVPPSVLELKRLRAEYAKLKATYTESHPDVRALQRKIEGLESVVPAVVEEKPLAVASANNSKDLMLAKVQVKIDAANARLISLNQQKNTLRARMGQLQGEIIQSPQVERGLITLMRDHENAQKKYEEIRAKQINAKMAETLEEEKKAERFSLIEPPLVPEKPIKPDRTKIILIGFFLAMGGSGGLVTLLESMNQRIRGAEALTQLMRLRPLVVIPYITTRDEIARHKRRLVWVGVSMLFMAAISAALLHFMYMPLDVLMLKIFARFG